MQELIDNSLNITFISLWTTILPSPSPSPSTSDLSDLSFRRNLCERKSMKTTTSAYIENASRSKMIPSPRIFISFKDADIHSFYRKFKPICNYIRVNCIREKQTFLYNNRWYFCKRKIIFQKFSHIKIVIEKQMSYFHTIHSRWISCKIVGYFL